MRETEINTRSSRKSGSSPSRAALPHASTSRSKHPLLPTYQFIPNPTKTPKIQMATSAPTIIDLKTSFLRSQILALQRPLRPSPDFETAISASENALRQRTIDDALNRLNASLRKHNKVAYGPQAQRHVAEQIDKLYWSAGERGVVGEVEDWAGRGADYREFDLGSGWGLD